MISLETLTYHTTGRIARITLDRPERGNGITLRLVSELEQCVERADLDPAVHAILLSGNGKGFCGGYDLVESAEGQGRLGDEGPAREGPELRRDGAPPETRAARGRVPRRPQALRRPAGSPLDPAVMAANHDPAGTWDAMVDYAMMSRNVRAFMSLFHCGKPVVCKVHGFCVAGGTDMALCSDLLVIAADAKIGYPPARVWGSPTTSMWMHRLGAAARQAFAVHGRLAVGDRGAGMGPCDRGARARSARRAHGDPARADRARAAQPAADDEAARQPVSIRAGPAHHADRSARCSTGWRATPPRATPSSSARCRQGSARRCANATSRSAITARRPSRGSPTTATDAQPPIEPIRSARP